MVSKVVRQREQLVLFLGDIVFFYISLWITLTLRYLEMPSPQIWSQHFLPFSILFFVWVIVFYVAGLYERYVTIVKKSLPTIVVETLFINWAIAVLFFYFIPLFGIAPKTNLFIYLIVSLIITLFWRVNLFPYIAPKTVQNAMIIARGNEMKELRDEVNSSRYYGYTFTQSINLDSVDSINVQQDIIKVVYESNITTIVIDTKDDTIIPLLPHFYNLMFSQIAFIDMHDMYEEVFGRIPLSLVKHGWFLENVHSKPHIMYDTLKRLMDIVISLFCGIISLIVYPVVFVSLKLDDGGPLFFIDKRIGKNNRPITILKFRSMRVSNGDTKDISWIGNFLRVSRIDELPQLWNVLKGDLSLIGPRPERDHLVDHYRKEVSYYNVRHLIKPGLSGWAQMKHDNHPHHNADSEATREKLAYDLYYVKNRSFILDIKITLQTLKSLLMRKGR